MSDQIYPRPGPSLSLHHTTPLPLPPSTLSAPSATAWRDPAPPPALQRTLPPSAFPHSLLATIHSLEDRLRASPLFLHVMAAQARRPVASRSVVVLPDGHLALPSRRLSADLPVYYGFPKSDDDVEYCLEDTPGLSDSNFLALKTSLMDSLTSVRRMAHDAVLDMESNLAQQVLYRCVQQDEVHRRLSHVVARFCKTRKEILHKYRAYVRNRRWIENIATRQRRGCLTHRQNNILRLWLFTHFSNPYPDVQEKRLLMRDTSLSATQVNNWLINARSRVWKPTVEMMSGDRVKKDMNDKEARYADFRHDPAVDGPRPPVPGFSRNENTNDAQNGDLPHTRLHHVVSHAHHSQHAAQHPASQVERVAEDPSWMPQQNWASIELPVDPSLNN